MKQFRRPHSFLCHSAATAVFTAVRVDRTMCIPQAIWRFFVPRSTSKTNPHRNTQSASATASQPRARTGFAALGVPQPLADALASSGITDPTPIQQLTVADAIAGRDVLGRGRTGSGKTLAFVLPVLTRLAADPARRKQGKPRALILAPTRELAQQIETVVQDLGPRLGLRSTTIYGGVRQGYQVQALERGVDIVVACPGRLEDLLQQGHVQLDQVRTTVIDEADHMADLGFLPAVKRLLDLTPPTGQRLLFSATLDAAVGALVKRYLRNPLTHEAADPDEPTGVMTHHVLAVRHGEHQKIVEDLAASPGRTVVFVRTKFRAARFAKKLNDAGIPAVELHGDLSQRARAATMDAFHSGAAHTLVATDIAARGIHVDDVSLVIHADPPQDPKAYVHRSGRTARAGASGTVVTLMLPEQERDVRTMTRQANIAVTITRTRPGYDILQTVAPGERAFPGAFVPAPVAASQRPAREQGQGGARRGGPRAGGRTTAAGSQGGQTGQRGQRGSRSRTGQPGQRSDAARQGGTRVEGRRSEGTRSEGPRREGTRHQRTGARHQESTRSDGQRRDGQRRDGARREGGRVEGRRGSTRTQRPRGAKGGRVQRDSSHAA